MNERYSLVFCGKITEGEDPDKVRQKVQKLLNIDPLRLDRLFSGRRLFIKKDLDRAMAERCKQAFDATGAVCVIERNPQSKPLSPQNPVAQRVRCPKCGMEQEKNSICVKCGIVIAKYLRRQEAKMHGSTKDAPLYPDPDADTNRMRETENHPTKAGALSRLTPGLIIITLIIVGVYIGYRQLVPTTEGNIVFTSNDCGDPCQVAMIHLQREGIDFAECNIDVSKDNLKRFQKYGSTSLPLTVLNGTALVGYNQTKYQIQIDISQGKYLAESADKVVIYTTQTCGYCRRARNFFNEQGIEYTEYDIADPRNRLRYEELRGRGVPLILIDGNRIDGFQAQAVTELLRKAHMI